MYQSSFNYAESRVQELRLAANPHYRDLDTSSHLGNQMRQGAGEALIALGNWIKPSKMNAASRMKLYSAQIGGR